MKKLVALSLVFVCVGVVNASSPTIAVSTINGDSVSTFDNTTSSDWTVVVTTTGAVSGDYVEAQVKINGAWVCVDSQSVTVSTQSATVVIDTSYNQGGFGDRRVVLFSTGVIIGGDLPMSVVG